MTRDILGLVLALALLVFGAKATQTEAPTDAPRAPYQAEIREAVAPQIPAELSPEDTFAPSPARFSGAAPGGPRPS